MQILELLYLHLWLFLILQIGCICLMCYFLEWLHNCYMHVHICSHHLQFLSLAGPLLLYLFLIHICLPTVLLCYYQHIVRIAVTIAITSILPKIIIIFFFIISPLFIIVVNFIYFFFFLLLLL